VKIAYLDHPNIDLPISARELGHGERSQRAMVGHHLP